LTNLQTSGDVFITSCGKEKNIHCPTCGKVTQHVSLTYSDMNKIANNTYGKTMANLIDINPLTKPIAGVWYQCESCGSYRTYGKLFGDIFIER
jgi:hypothetical protein